MDRRIAQILLLNLAACLIGALITIFYLEQKEADVLWLTVSVFVWLVSAFLLTYYYWQLQIYKDKPHRTTVFFWGLLAPLPVLVFLMCTFMSFMYRVVPSLELKAKNLYKRIGWIE